ncbi:hypothetical protein BASA81_002402 [Batrachochytrium salamandrivorans]|nr:hypothetical protein BASA81_002402 [Batrachochytrium salamandrivorans]
MLSVLARRKSVWFPPRLGAVQTREFSTTKGHKKTRRLRARALYLRKHSPPKALPWYLHKKPHPELVNMLTNYDQMYRIREIASLMFDLMMSSPALTPMDERLREISKQVEQAEKDWFTKAKFPSTAEVVLKELGLPVPAKAHLTGSRDEVNRVLVDVLSTPNPNLPKHHVPPSPSSLPLHFAQDQHSLQVRAEEVQMKINEKIQISWLQETALHETETAASLQSVFDAKQELGMMPHVSFGVRMVNAYMRERDFDKAWATFNAFHKYEHRSLDLYAVGMKVLSKRRNPTRAMSLFDQAEDVFPRADLPYLYHATMRATKSTRQSTWYTFDLYNRMTKVDCLLPTPETLRIVLETCAVLGDVERAKLMWHEMVDTYGVVPDEFAHTSMLNTIARGNRMLRAKALKPGSVKVLTFQDKALLATCGGFINAPIKFTDEVQDVLHELKGFAPNPANYQSDYDRYRQLQEEAEDREEDGESMLEDEEEDELVEEEPEPVTAVPAVVPKPSSDLFLLPGETEEDFMGEDDDEDEKKRQAEEEQEAARRKKEKEEALADGGIAGDEHCIFIPGVSPDMPHSQTSGLSAKDTFAKLIELGQSHIPAVRDPNSFLAEPKEITGTSNGERQEANIQLANKFLSDITVKYNQPITTEILNAHMKVFATALRLHRTKECLALYEAHGVKPDVYTYNTLISMYCRAQRLSKAFELFQLMQSDGVQITRMTVGPLVDALGRNDRLEEAYDMYIEYKNHDLLEKHIRYVRNQFRLKQDPRLNDFPDPNFWRSTENMSTQLHKLRRSKEAVERLLLLGSERFHLGLFKYRGLKLHHPQRNAAVPARNHIVRAPRTVKRLTRCHIENVALERNVDLGVVGSVEGFERLLGKLLPSHWPSIGQMERQSLNSFGH